MRSQLMKKIHDTAGQDSFYDERMVCYAMNQYQLQLKTGMTFIEAEAFLSQYYGFVHTEPDHRKARRRSNEFIIVSPDVTPNDLMQSALNRAKKKLAACEFTLDEIFENYIPSKDYFMHCL